MALIRDSIQDQLGQWRDTAEGPFIGGLNTDVDPELIDENQFVQAHQAIVTYKELQSDTGTVLVGQIDVRGDPRRVIDYVNPTTNGTQRFLVTNVTVYAFSFVALQWQYVSNGTETTLTANEAAASTALDVASITGFADNDFIGIELDNGQMHFTQVNGAPAAGVINIDVGLPSAAAIGRAVIKAVSLNGGQGAHVSFVVVPWSGHVVFTNGQIDNVKIIDPVPGLHGSCVDLTGTGLPANMKCNSVTLYDNSLILAGCVEAGTLFLSRFRYSAKGDLTLWNTLEAGSTDLLENFGEIMQALPLGPYLIFYRRRGISRVSIGGAGRFTPDAAVPVAAGVMSKLAAVDLVDKHIVLGHSKLYWYRGGFAIEEVECSIREQIWGKSGTIKTLDVSPASMFLVPLLYRNEVLLSWGTGVTSSLPRYHIDSGAWTMRNFDAGAGRISGFGEAQVTNGDSLGTTFLCEAVEDKVVLYDQLAATDAGDTISFLVDTKDFAHKSLLTKMDFFEIKASGTGTLTISYSTDGGVTPVTLGTCALTATPTRFRFYKQVTAQRIRFRLTCPTAVTVHFINFRHEFTAEF